VELIMGILEFLGLPGVFGLMTLESMCIPIPSEVILPFSGALVYMGRLSIFGDPLLDTMLVALAGTFGCTAGSIIAYYIGILGGRPFVIRYGRYVHMHEGHLELAERWFEKYGDWAVFGSRLLPIVRTFISLPAGMASMPFQRFVILSTIGSFPWCLTLAFVGLVLGENWHAVEALYRPMEIVVVVGAVGLVAYYLYKRHRQSRSVTP
jgi:membrane protein DedA with SNARE-associated domain